MVYKKDSIIERLLKLDEAFSILHTHKNVSWNEYQSNKELQWVVERGFIIAAEMVFALGAHILSSKFSSYPDEYEEIILELGHKNVISPNLAKRLKGFAGFRNVLVHEYVSLDPRKVYEALTKNLDILKRYSKEIGKWLENN